MSWCIDLTKILYISADQSKYPFHFFWGIVTFSCRREAQQSAGLLISRTGTGPQNRLEEEEEEEQEEEAEVNNFKSEEEEGDYGPDIQEERIGASNRIGRG